MPPRSLFAIGLGGIFICTAAFAGKPPELPVDRITVSNLPRQRPTAFISMTRPSPTSSTASC